VPAIPRSWIDQLTEGGKVLTDLKIAQNAGSFVPPAARVRRRPCRGPNRPTYAAFMNLHPTPTAGRALLQLAGRPGPVTDRRTTTVDPRTPWTSLVVWFLAAFDLGRDVSIGYSGTDPTHPPSAVRIATPDGSWAEIDPDDQLASGSRVVTEGGSRALWQMVERAHGTWDSNDRPGWERFGITITPGRQAVWLDGPDVGSR
jgi:hypothetical protein